MTATITKPLNSLRQNLLFNIIIILSTIMATAHITKAGGVRIAWDANGEANLTGYYVYYSTNSPGEEIIDQGGSPIMVRADQLEDPNKPTLKMTGLQGGQTYFVAITAFNANGVESDFSNMITYAPPPSTHTIFAVSNEFGTLSQEGQIEVLEGTTKTLMVLPDPFCHVVDVTLDGVSLGAVPLVTIDNINQDHVIRAVFEKPAYILTLTSSNHGQISQEGQLAASHGSNQTFFFIPDPNCRIIDVLVDGISKGPIESLTLHNITGSHTIEALFEKDTYTITAITGENGTITPNGVGTYEYGSTQTFTITPDESYAVLDIMVDGISIGAVTEYTFDIITAPHSIEAVFAQAANEFAFEANELWVNHNWKHVSYQKTYANPVVIAGSHSLNDSSPAVVRIQNVTRKGFDVCLQEWDYLDDLHAFERVGYVVMEAGSHILPDGSQVAAGNFSVTAIDAFEEVFFNTPFNVTPVVVAIPSTANGNDTLTTRVKNVDTEKFQLMLQRQQKIVSDDTMETVSFIAWEPSQGNIDGTTFEIGATPSKVTHNDYRLYFKQFFSSSPSFISALQTYNGGDTVSVRWRDKSEDEVTINLAEEQSLDEETYHIEESVGFMLFLP